MPQAAYTLDIKAAESAQGTLIPPASSIVDSRAWSWTRGSAHGTGGDFKILINGKSAHGDDYGREVLYWDRKVHARDSGGWWLYVGTQSTRWKKTPDPRTSPPVEPPVIPPVEPPPPAGSIPFEIPSSALVNGALPAGSRTLVASAAKSDGTPYQNARLVYAQTHAARQVTGLSFEIVGSSIYLRAAVATQSSLLVGAVIELW